ncbi:MAG: hypothetical protein R3281_12975 [Balneolaceae bacterium]|nr:hypothetical protein [Balneolaceae bacterium]
MLKLIACYPQGLRLAILDFVSAYIFYLGTSKPGAGPGPDFSPRNLFFSKAQVKSPRRRRLVRSAGDLPCNASEGQISQPFTACIDNFAAKME